MYKKQYYVILNKTHINTHNEQVLVLALEMSCSIWII